MQVLDLEELDDEVLLELFNIFSGMKDVLDEGEVLENE